MAVLLPIEIQTNTTLYAKNEELRQLRAEFAEAVSKMESGSYSIKTTFEGFLTQINGVLDFLISAVETTIVPKDQFQDFLDGLTTLDEFANFDTLDYYNGLVKLKLFLKGVDVALKSLQDVPTKPITPAISSENGILDSLDSKEFLEQGAENPVFEVPQSYIYYVVLDGDTLPSIASKLYGGDTERWPEIAQVNQLSDSDLLDNNLVGTTLKIPVDATSINNLQNKNHVYETFFDGTSQKMIDRFNYGRDIDLRNKKMSISPTGDLKRVEGVSCVVQNVQSRYHNTKGSLNPLNPTWGLLEFGSANDVPFTILLDRLLTDAEYQALSDPRVVDASIDRKNIKLNGDRLDLDMIITLIGSRVIMEAFEVKNIL